MPRSIFALESSEKWQVTNDSSDDHNYDIDISEIYNDDIDINGIYIHDNDDLCQGPAWDWAPQRGKWQMTQVMTTIMTLTLMAYIMMTCAKVQPGIGLHREATHTLCTFHWSPPQETWYWSVIIMMVLVDEQI